MRKLALLAAPAALALSAAPAQASHNYIAKLKPLNDSGVTGHAHLKHRDGALRVQLKARGLVPDRLHMRHIHGFGGGDAKNATCPPASAAGGDGVLEVGEGAPFYGPVQLSLTPFSMAPRGRMHLDRRYTATDGDSDLSAILPLHRQTIVLHGGFVGSEYVESLPVACGTVQSRSHDRGRGRGRGKGRGRGHQGRGRGQGRGGDHTSQHRGRSSDDHSGHSHRGRGSDDGPDSADDHGSRSGSD